MLISKFIIWRLNHDRTLIESEDEIAWQHNGHISSSFERWLLQHTQVKSVMKIIRKTHQILSTGETLDNISFTFQVLSTRFFSLFSSLYCNAVVDEVLHRNRWWRIAFRNDCCSLLCYQRSKLFEWIGHIVAICLFYFNAS